VDERDVAGTAIEALTRGYEAFKDPSYLTTAAGALPIFSVAPTTGVRVRTAGGARYLQYSFAPSVSILNAFLQSLIGLYDFAKVSHNTRAQQLFAAGNAEAQAEVPHFIAGGWSEYQPGVIDTLSYHQLVTGFLAELCSRTSARVYCATAKLFNADLTTEPALTLLTKRARGGSTASVSFELSKYAHVGIVVLQGARTVFSTSTYEWNGKHSLSVGKLAAGSYTIHLTATDLAGNFTRAIGSLSVS
jgi:hypothetical protein